MAQIFKYPEVEDYFEVLHSNQSATVLGREATHLYEASRAVLLKGIKIACDREFLPTLHFDPDVRAVKTFTSLNFTKTYG